jgi:D-sedoheptulose 7-phosphate isomerase
MTRIDDSISEALRLGDWLRQHERTERTVQRLSERLAACLEQGGRIIACGNGGSMCDAMHFAGELSGRYRDDRPALPAQAIGDSTHLTCVGNDYGFDRVFARGVEAWGREGDVLVVFSTSGNSPNVVAAVEAARAAKLGVLGLLGRGGGCLRDRCDLAIVVPGSTSDRIQEVHIKVVHLMIEQIEHRLFSSSVP